MHIIPWAALGYGLVVSICTLLGLWLGPELLNNLFAANGFIPHGHCYLWKPGLVSLHVATDTLIGLAYVSISVTLVYLVHKARRDIPFHSVFIAFGFFIIACGATHFIEVWTLWMPVYWLSGTIKLITAIASVTTALVIPPLVPQVLTLIASAKTSEDRKLQLETANVELETLYQKLKELDQLKTQFFANVSHDLRTPLALILGPTEKLLSEPNLTNPEQRQNLELVDRNARTLLKRVNDLLDVSKLEAGKMEVNYALSDVAELVRLIAANFETIAEDRQISFVVETPSSLRASVDPDKWQRICFNLLSNAFKFTPMGGSIRCILAEVSPQEQGHRGTEEQVFALDSLSSSSFTLTIEDTGPGVPPELREAIFEPYRQEEFVTQQGFGGTGLGLAIVKEFVELHGGSIEVNQAPKGGAVFTTWMPQAAPSDVLSTNTEGLLVPDGNRDFHLDGETIAIAQPAATDFDKLTSTNLQIDSTRSPQAKTSTNYKEIALSVMAELGHQPNDLESGLNYQSSKIFPSEQSAQNPQGEIYNSQSPLVLVVEDNPEMNRFIVESLAPENRVVSARNGQEGLEKAIALHPDLILTDMMMPQMNGDQLVREVRAIKELDTIPIVLLTAKADDELRVQMLREGVQDYLMKPFHIEELRARVGNAIAMKRTREILQQELQTLDIDLATLARELTSRQRELQASHQNLEIRVRERTAELATANELLQEQIALAQQAEQELRKSEQRFRSYFELPLVGIAISSPDKGWLDANDKLCDIFGYSRQELTQMTWDQLTHPDDLPADVEQFQRILAGEIEAYSMDKRFIRKDGQTIHASISTRCVRRTDGSIDYFVALVQDITERYQALQALKWERSILRSFFDSASLMMGIVELVEDDIRHISDNSTSAKFFGLTPEAMQNRLSSSLGVPPQYLRLWIHQYRLAQRTQTTIRFEYPHETDLGKKWLSASVCPIEGASSLHPKFAYVIEDITNRKKSEKERLQLVREQEARAQAEEAQQRYLSLAEAIPQMVWTAQPDGSVDYYNQRWFDYTGTTLEQAQGWGWQPILHPDDLQASVDGWNNAIDTGETYEAECRFKRASDGVYRWHLVRALPLRDRHQWVVKWFGTCTDIDDRKRAEQSRQFLSEAGVVLADSLDYQATLERLVHLAVPHLADWCAVHTVEPDGSIRQRAVAHADASKVELAWEVERRYPFDPKVPRGLAKVLHTGEAKLAPEVSDELLVAIARDPEHLEILRKADFKSYMCLPLIARGRILGAIAFITAESGRHYNQADLSLASELAHRAALAVDNARLYHEAQEANRMKDQFLAIVSHELRTPINAVLGWAQLLRSRKFDENRTAQALETIERNAKAQTQLIESLLDVSRMIRGNLPLSLLPVDLVPVIQTSINSVLATAQTREIQVETVLDPSCGRVQGDPVRLQQVMSNLLSNALKFTPNGGQVTVRMSIVIGNRSSVMANAEESHQLPITNYQLPITHYAQIQISDTGVGITPDFLPHVFDLFRQADSTTTRSHGGLGLGLAIVRYLVEMHGGTVSAQSPGEGLGATFTVRLPLLESTQVELKTSGVLAHQHEVPTEVEDTNQERKNSSSPSPSLNPQSSSLNPQSSSLNPHSSSPSSSLNPQPSVLSPQSSSLNPQSSVLSPQSSSSSLNPHALSGLRLLLVEDDADIREVVVTTLEEAGASVRAVASVPEAMKALDRELPDLVISDIGMPLEDGYGLIRQLRNREAERGGKIPAIALTAYATEEDQQQTLAAGYQRHLSKPVETAQLVAVVANLWKSAGQIQNDE
ncbi:PAS domain S-box protein [Trichocoleus sp. ST-U3]|uniref:PAS domain S-box protein n=1 Tax=Coleofasciculus sp. FACHB-542 TaxID=2692787 RepID=UPI001F549544|nr:PAS domain S-box protein [Coleofasciculus sp. FACHB-542]